MRYHITFKTVLDILFVLSYSIGYVSLLKYVTYAIFPIPESIQLFLFLGIIYLIRFGLTSGGIKRKESTINLRLVFFLVVLYLWEILQGVIVGSERNGILVVGVNLLSTYIAYKYLSNLINTYCSIKSVINAYSTYMYYTLFVVIVASVLILTGLLSPYTNQLGMNSLMKDNMENHNAAYYFPGCLSVVYPTPSILLSGFNFPSLSGLSHESQAMYFTIFPALFLRFFMKTNIRAERNTLILFLVTTILTTSLTAAVCFLITYCLHLLWKLRDRSQFNSALLILFFITLFGYWVIQSQFSSIINAFILEKANFDTVGSSGSDSLSLFTYIFSPSGILGQGIFSSTADQRMQLSSNCGYISSFLIIVFYLFFIYTSLKNVFSDRLICHAIGLASFYFIAHSFKYGIQLFNSNYLFFMVFLLAYAEKIRVGNNHLMSQKRNFDHAIYSVEVE